MLPDFRVRQRDYLLEIARALTEELDLDALLNRILSVSVEMLAGQAGLIALRTETGGWKVQVSQGIPPVFLRLLTPYLSQIPENPDPQRFELPEINRVLKELTRTASLGLLTGVGLPLVARQRVVGVIFIFRSYPDLFSGNDRNSTPRSTATRNASRPCWTPPATAFSSCVPTSRSNAAIPR
jgi:GAF domain-containing protein